jgi:hypothetical protein
VVVASDDYAIPARRRGTRTLGFEIPPTLLIRADEGIE